MGRVLKGEAAMTIMGDWGEGLRQRRSGPEVSYRYADKIGFMPMPGTAGTFVFTTDTFGLPMGARHPEEAQKLLSVFGSRGRPEDLQRMKGSISARLDVEIAPDDDRRPTYDDFVDAGNDGKIIRGDVDSRPADLLGRDQRRARRTSPDKGADGSISEVQHTLDNYADLIRTSCWPNCHAPAP